MPDDLVLFGQRLRDPICLQVNRVLELDQGYTKACQKGHQETNEQRPTGFPGVPNHRQHWDDDEDDNNNDMSEDDDGRIVEGAWVD